ncbi:hypothetical protein GCM10022280_19420 [Sphingomonas swuensis]|uniref:Uncharacterized protein n=1 Tax=Sphingomonas swuensis TaxID=977800 RepID=A0ABP7T1C2_9SPHN
MSSNPHRFPLAADPGDVVRSVLDDLLYRLDWDDRWYPYGDGHKDRTPIPHVPADDPERVAAMDAASIEINARIRAEEAAAREAWVAAQRRKAEPEAARTRLAAAAAERPRGEDDDGECGVYEGEYAAVIAEVPPGIRRDGWTAERRILFLERVAEHGSILAAARAAGMTRRSVYKLCPRAPAFAAALNEALMANTVVLADTLFDRAIHGHEVPIVHKGEVVATRTVHHDLLGCYLLRVRDPLNYAPVDELERRKGHRALEAAAPPPAAVLPPPRSAATPEGPTL